MQGCKTELEEKGWGAEELPTTSSGPLKGHFFAFVQEIKGVIENSEKKCPFKEGLRSVECNRGAQLSVGGCRIHAGAYYGEQYRRV